MKTDTRKYDIHHAAITIYPWHQSTGESCVCRFLRHNFRGPAAIDSLLLLSNPRAMVAVDRSTEHFTRLSAGIFTTSFNFQTLSTNKLILPR
jgi:hypothetical protein